MQRRRRLQPTVLKQPMVFSGSSQPAAAGRRRRRRCMMSNAPRVSGFHLCVLHKVQRKVSVWFNYKNKWKLQLSIYPGIKTKHTYWYLLQSKMYLAQNRFSYKHSSDSYIIYEQNIMDGYTLEMNF